jgi:hypothetical protein
MGDDHGSTSRINVYDQALHSQPARATAAGQQKENGEQRHLYGKK